MKKNLIFYFYLKDNNRIDGTAHHHLNLLKRYSHIFDGQKILYLATDKEPENKEEILSLFGFLGEITYKFVKNDPELRESKYFIPMINEIRDRNSLTFFGHSKGLTTEGSPDSMMDWIISMYYFNLEPLYLPNIWNSLYGDSVFAGILRKDIPCPPCVSSNWHYSGTFFWFNTKKVFERSLDFYKYGRFEVESFPGNHSDVSKSYCEERFTWDNNFDARYSFFWANFFDRLTENELLDYKKVSRKISIDDLTKITNFLGSDKGNYVDEKHGYTEIYSSLFSLKRNSEIKLLEIGIKDPRFPYASVKIWDTFFNKVEIIGLDINNSSELEELIPNFTYLYLDQYSDESHEKISNKFNQEGKTFDYIIDDGPHYFDAQIKSFNHLFGFLRKGGYYIVEDLHVDREFINYIQNSNIPHELHCNGKLMIIPK
jgi:hypothetical protein